MAERCSAKILQRKSPNQETRDIPQGSAPPLRGWDTCRCRAVHISPMAELLYTNYTYFLIYVFYEYLDKICFHKLCKLIKFKKTLVLKSSHSELRFECFVKLKRFKINITRYNAHHTNVVQWNKWENIFRTFTKEKQISIFRPGNKCLTLHIFYQNCKIEPRYK